MPGRVYEGALTVPAGTPQSAPATFVIPMPNGHIADVNLVVPNGHNGLTGFQLILSGTPIIPYGGASFLVANDYDKSWDIDQDFNEGQVVMAGFNTDIFAHTFYCRILWESTPPPPVAVSIGAPAAATVAQVSTLAQPPAETAPIETAVSAAGELPAGGCLDASFNQVDCSDPAAVYDSNGDLLAGTAPDVTGSSQTAATAAGGCYDSMGNPVDCSDPTAAFDANGDPLQPAALPPPAGPESPPPAPGIGGPPPPPALPPVSIPGAPAPPPGTIGGPRKSPAPKPGRPGGIPPGGPVGGGSGPKGGPPPKGTPRPTPPKHEPEPPHKAPPIHHQAPPAKPGKR